MHKAQIYSATHSTKWTAEKGQYSLRQLLTTTTRKKYYYYSNNNKILLLTIKNSIVQWPRKYIWSAVDCSAARTSRIEKISTDCTI